MSNVTVSRTDLHEALSQVSPGLAGSAAIIAQSANFAFLNGRVITYNDDISISRITNLDDDVQGSVNAAALISFLSRVTAEEISIEWGESQIVMKAGKAKAGFAIEAEIKLPLEEVAITKGTKWYPLPANFRDALKFCIPCASNDLSRPALTCLSFEKDTIKATDSFRIATHSLSEPLSTAKCLLPAATALKLLPYEVTEITQTVGWLHFRTADRSLIFSARTLADSTFPDISKILATDDGNALTLPEPIKDILTRAEVFAKNEKVEEFGIVIIALNKGRATLSTKNAHGWYEEKCRVEYDGDPITFTIGIDFLTTIVEQTQSCEIESNRIRFSGAGWNYVVAIWT